MLEIGGGSVRYETGLWQEQEQERTSIGKDGTSGRESRTLHTACKLTVSFSRRYTKCWRQIREDLLSHIRYAESRLSKIGNRSQSYGR